MPKDPFKSLFELKFSKALTKRGIPFKYEPETLAFLQPEKKRKYTPDFLITTKDGNFLVETKGKLTAEDRKKMVWVKEQHPNKKIVIVFMNAGNRLTKVSKTTYGDWADKQGYEWVDFRNGLPKNWRPALEA